MPDNKTKILKGLREKSLSATTELKDAKQEKLASRTKPFRTKALTDIKKEDMLAVEGLPMIMRLPADSYRKVDPAKLKEWQKAVSERLGKPISIAADMSATESFSRDEDTKSSFKTDYDADRSSNQKTIASDIKGERLLPWPSTPIVLAFPPLVFEKVSKAALPAWADLMKEKLGISGINFDDFGAGETVSWCEEFPFGPGGPKVLYTCDCDMDGPPIAARR